MIVRFEPSGVRTEIEAGHTILEAATAAGVEIESVCGGRGTCSKCKVVAPHGLAAPTAHERHGLSADELARGYRLACQAVITGNVDVMVPDESRRSRVSILAEGARRDFEVDPWVRRLTLRVPAATLEDQLPDWRNVQRALGDRADAHHHYDGRYWGGRCTP